MIYRDDRIRSEMAAQKLNDGDMAGKTGLTRQIIAALRKGDAKDVKLSTLESVAAALGKDVPWLLEPKAAADRVARETSVHSRLKANQPTLRA